MTFNEQGMNLRRKLRKLLEHLTHTHIYRTPPHGMDVAFDIARSLPTFQVNTIFDVGANIGQSARLYLELFPQANIYCFEPVSQTFQHLKANLKDHDRVQCFQLGLGASVSTGKMILEGTSDLFHLWNPSQETLETKNTSTEEINIVTLDEFCLTQNIHHINFLKIDTEGADLDVLKGGKMLLSKQQVDFVEVEAGMNADNQRHVPFETLKNFLEEENYLLFGVYEQIQEWPTQQPHLRRTNPVFISRRLIKN